MNSGFERHDATVLLVNGMCVVEHADDVIWVHPDLYEQLTGGVADDAPIGAGELVDGVFSFGTPGEGLGRLSYRYVRYDAGVRVHVFERIADVVGG